MSGRTSFGTDGFEKALGELCTAKGIDGWRDFLSPDEEQQFFKDVHDPDARRVIAFWAELDEPLEHW